MNCRARRRVLGKRRCNHRSGLRNSAGHTIIPPRMTNGVPIAPGRTTPAIPTEINSTPVYRGSCGVGLAGAASSVAALGAPGESGSGDGCIFMMFDRPACRPLSPGATQRPREAKLSHLRPLSTRPVGLRLGSDAVGGKPSGIGHIPKEPKLLLQPAKVAHVAEKTAPCAEVGQHQRSQRGEAE